MKHQISCAWPLTGFPRAVLRENCPCFPSTLHTSDITHACSVVGTCRSQAGAAVTTVTEQRGDWIQRLTPPAQHSQHAVSTPHPCCHHHCQPSGGHRKMRAAQSPQRGCEHGFEHTEREAASRTSTSVKKAMLKSFFCNWGCCHGPKPRGMSEESLGLELWRANSWVRFEEKVYNCSLHELSH